MTMMVISGLMEHVEITTCGLCFHSLSCQSSKCFCINCIDTVGSNCALLLYSCRNRDVHLILFYLNETLIGYIPNCALGVKALLATASIGAVWSSASPDFGVTVCYISCFRNPRN